MTVRKVKSIVTGTLQETELGRLKIGSKKASIAEDAGYLPWALTGLTGIGPRWGGKERIRMKGAGVNMKLVGDYMRDSRVAAVQEASQVA